MNDFNLSPADFSEAQRFVISCGLPNATPIEVLPADLVAILPWAAEHRLVGLLHEAATQLDATVPTEIADAHLAMLRHAVGVEVEACRAVSALREVGVDPVVFKGVAAARLDYDDPALRSFYDVDLLVSRAELTRAVRQLERAGRTRIESKLGRKWEEGFGRAVQFVSKSGIELDLHASLAAGYFGVRLDHGALLESTSTFDLGGIEMRSFEVDARLLASSYALVLSRGGNLRLLRDVAQQVCLSHASPERAAALAGDGAVVISLALQMVNRWIELPPAVNEWATAVPISRSQQRGLDLAQQAHQNGWRSDALGEMLGLGNLDRVRYAVGIAGSRVKSLRARRA